MSSGQLPSLRLLRWPCLYWDATPVLPLHADPTWYIVCVRLFKLAGPLLTVSLAPAQDAVEYQLKTFRYDPVFSAPPSDSLDKAWSDLYQFGISRITREDALLLPNKTSPIPGDEGYYIAELEVFHGLHCLNMIRKTLYSEYYTDMRLGIDGNDDHISHCVDSLRQTLMCSSDISTIVWQWHEKENRNLAHADVARTCRNFEAIQKWGRDNRMRVPYNDSIRVHDDDMADNSTGY
ncbi:hypothetical protein BDZ89DRAFT_962939 [Hymenopellis radicata]|nr:hypothetical protein BDZ89DRAFT_962939 [Hymenopellis radicata]